MLNIKPVTIKRLKFKLKSFIEPSEETIIDFIKLIISEPSWALQDIAFKVGKLFNIKGKTQKDVAQIGCNILDKCDGIFYDISINYQPLHDIYSGRVIPKVVYGKKEKHTIEPRIQIADKVEIKCSKRFWRKQDLSDIQDVINYLGNTKYKLNNYILEYKDNSYKDSAYPELELSRANEMYNKYKDKILYFDWFIDARGRVYSKGYHINIQGTKYKKAVLDMVTNKVDKKLSDNLANLIKGE